MSRRKDRFPSLSLAICLSIIQPLRYVLQKTSCVRTELLQVCFNWLSSTCSSEWRGPTENITYESERTPPTVSCMSCSSGSGGFRNRSLLFCGMLLQRLVQYSLRHSSAVAVKLFLYTLSQCQCSTSIY